MKISVIGAGSWGTALSLVLHSNKHTVKCWTIDRETIKDVKNSAENTRYLPGIKIPEEIMITDDIKEAAHDADIVLNSVPSQVVRQVVPQVCKALECKDKIWVSVAKGIENTTHLRISEVIHQVADIPVEKVVVLSGPSHAEEVARNIPTAVVSSCPNLESATEIQHLFMTPYFRIYANTDIIGVELGGALKNIVALAAGICD
ncbi:MAG: NAD(P)-binding domain-containing protein, partial [Calditrichaceae bacterium]